jgi:hypothetical protein
VNEAKALQRDLLAAPVADLPGDCPGLFKTVRGLGFVTAPALARLVNPGLLLVGAGALLTGWGILGLWYRPLRHLEDALPDAIAGPEIAEDLDQVQAEIDARVHLGRGDDPARVGRPGGAQRGSRK